MANSPERKKRTCIVPVCSGERFDLVHKFPMDYQRAKQWKDLINNPILSDMTIDLIRRRYFVCSRHFKVQDYKNIKSRGLNKTAIPSMNMKEFSDPENCNRFECCVYHIDMNKTIEETVYKKVEQELPLVYSPPKVKKRKIEIHEDLSLIKETSAEVEVETPSISLGEEAEEEEFIEEHLKEINNTEIEMILPQNENSEQSPIDDSNNPESKCDNLLNRFFIKQQTKLQFI